MLVGGCLVRLLRRGRRGPTFGGPSAALLPSGSRDVEVRRRMRGRLAGGVGGGRDLVPVAPGRDLDLAVARQEGVCRTVPEPVRGQQLVWQSGVEEEELAPVVHELDAGREGLAVVAGEGWRGLVDVEEAAMGGGQLAEVVGPCGELPVVALEDGRERLDRSSDVVLGQDHVPACAQIPGADPHPAGEGAVAEPGQLLAECRPGCSLVLGEGVGQHPPPTVPGQGPPQVDPVGGLLEPAAPLGGEVVARVPAVTFGGDDALARQTPERLPGGGGCDAEVAHHRGQRR